jgi:quinol monooxygenase YgiN
MLAGRSATEEDVVYVVEAWSSEARTSDAVTAWAEGLAPLVAGPPVTVRLDQLDGKGLRTAD